MQSLHSLTQLINNVNGRAVIHLMLMLMLLLLLLLLLRQWPHLIAAGFTPLAVDGMNS